MLIFIYWTVSKKVLNAIKKLKIPSIYLNKYYKNNSFPSVSIDNFEGGLIKWLNILKKLGHKKNPIYNW